jgi:hypothetical protein
MGSLTQSKRAHLSRQAVCLQRGQLILIAVSLPCTIEQFGEASTFLRTEACHELSESVVGRLAFEI